MADKDKSFQKRVEEALAKGEPLPGFPEVSPIRSLAMAQNECCQEFEKEGFKRNEALYLTASMFNGHPGIAPGM